MNKIKHKNILTTKVINDTLTKQKNVSKGALFVLKKRIMFYHLSGLPDENGTLHNAMENKQNFIIFPMKQGECILFLDIIWEPFTKHHYIRFLHNKNIVAIDFKKGFTFRMLSKNFDISGQTTLSV